MFFKEWMVKAAGIVGALLAVFGFVKLSNKNAADAREAEINADNLDELLNEIKDAKEIEQTIQKKYDREVNSKEIGELIMEKLTNLDEVAYVRFASVYRQFKDVNQFMSELKLMLDKR